MSQSKKQKIYIYSAIRDHALQAIATHIVDMTAAGSGDDAVLRSYRRRIADAIAQRIAFDPYVFKEIKDIMDWKQPPEVK